MLCLIVSGNSGQSEEGGGFSLQLIYIPGTYQNFVDYVIQKGCESQGRGKTKTATHIHLKKLPGSIENAISFDQLKNFKSFL